MVVNLDILWEHYRVDGDLPFISSDTGKVLSQLLEELRPAFEQECIALSFRESVIEPGSQSKPRLLINGHLFDDVLLEVAEEQRRCEGRRWEMSLPISFPKVSVNNRFYTSAPELLFRKALLRAAGII